jgi:Putative Ig domain
MKQVLLALVSLALGPSMMAQSITTSPLTVTGANISVRENVPFSSYVGPPQQNGGGIPPYTCSVVSGSFPTGVSSVTSACLVAGTATVSTPGTQVIQVSDSGNSSTTLSITVTPTTTSSIAVTPVISLSFNATQQMTAICTQSDGGVFNCTGFVTWASGTPSVAAISAIGVVTASAATSGTTQITASLSGTTSPNTAVTVASGTVVLTTATLPNGQINRTYPEAPFAQPSLTATGGTPPYTFALSSGAMPGGVTLNTATGAISGIATASGTFTPHFTATDSASHTSAAVTLNIVIASLSSVAVTPATVTLAAGGTQAFTLTGTFSDSSTANITVGAGGPVSWAIVQSKSGSSAGGSATTASVTLNNVSAGDVIGCGINNVDGGNSRTLSFVKDDLGNTLTLTSGTPLTLLASVGQVGTAYQLSAPTSGNRTYTATWTVADNYTIYCGEFSSLGGTTAFDTVASQASGSSSATINTPSFTPAGANDLLISCGLPRNAITAANSPWTLLGTIANAAACAYYFPVGVATVPNFAQNPAGTYQAQTMGFTLTSSGGVATVWSVTAGSCTITPMGVLTVPTGAPAGTCTVQGSVSAVSNTATVTIPASQTDTSVVVLPNPQTGNVGGFATFQAVGNVNSSNNYTSTATWTSSNTTVTGTGPYTNVIPCNAAGTSIITAAAPSLTSGTATLTCNAVLTTGLLSGCVVNSSNVPTCSTPSGWTFVIADNASSSLPTNVVLGSTTSKKSFGHSPGTTSYSALMNGDGASVSWFLNNSFTSFTSMYLSYWEYRDPNALYADSDDLIFYINNPSACPGAGGQAIALDAQFFTNNIGSTTSTTFLADGYFGSPSSANCQGQFFYNQASTQSINAGTWRQWEFLVTPNTTIATGGQTNGHPNCNNLTPSSPGCGNGTFQAWVNGTQVINILNANLNGIYAMGSAGTVLQVGGLVTSFPSINNESSRCTVWSSTGGGTCPGTQPGTGAPQPYNRYITDIIVLKK